LYDGKQVLRLETKIKSKDLFNIGIEMKNRKGTGNYDKDRTKFNYEYVSITERNLYQEVKKTLENKNIEYLNKQKTNLLNRVIFTSGNEFFESLGMKFVDSGRTYKTGDKKGQAVKVPLIKSENDIPQAVKYYFDSCMDYLKDFVGEENIVLAQVHYDEDTPHLQAYFLPIVNSVQRKSYEKDKSGNVIKIESKNKDGVITLVPKILRDDKGNIIYETHKGKFLNNDQFWKNKGGKTSYAKMQDSFNKYITQKGFKLDRGNIGANVENQTKLQYQINENKAELEELMKEKDYLSKQIETSKIGLEKATQSVNQEVLNPKKNVIGYNTKDVDKIVDYSKELEQIKVIQEIELLNKDKTIDKLTTQNESFKQNNELIKKNKIIEKQDSTIKEQKHEINRLKDLVNILNKNVESLKEKLEKEVDKWKNLFFKMCDAIDKVLGRKSKDYIEDYENLADSINLGYYDKKSKDKDDFDIGI
jgi:hypothetical protein